MTYFGDLKCPVCQDVHGCRADSRSWSQQRGAIREGQGGLRRVLHRDVQRPGPEEFPIQQVAALAAGKQNKFWQFTELFYRQQGSEEDAVRDRGLPGGLARQVTG